MGNQPKGPEGINLPKASGGGEDDVEGHGSLPRGPEGYGSTPKGPAGYGSTPKGPADYGSTPKAAGDDDDVEGHGLPKGAGRTRGE